MLGYNYEAREETFRLHSKAQGYCVFGPGFLFCQMLVMVRPTAEFL